MDGRQDGASENGWVGGGGGGGVPVAATADVKLIKKAT